nr:NAD-dependent epimerase/dehydratase family protein [Brucella intermedia]
MGPASWRSRRCCAAARASGGRCGTLRYFNAAGTESEGELGEDHDPDTRLIPLIVRASRGETPTLTAFGGRFHDTRDGTPIRNYVHVEDLAAAYLLVLEQLFQGQTDLVVNAGADGGVSVREVLQAAQDCLGRRVPAVVGARRGRSADAGGGHQPSDKAGVGAAQESPGHDHQRGPVAWKDSAGRLA